MTDTQTRETPPQRTKRQMLEETIEVGVAGDWERAIELNTAFLERFPRDPEALNRKGRALLELGRFQESWDAYTEALQADPANMIARRNLQRLEMLANTDASSLTPDDGVRAPRSGAFIQEVGKAWVDELTQSAGGAHLATVSPGEQLAFEEQEGKVAVRSRSGQHLGELEERIGRRLMELIAAGNRYEIYALGMSGHSLRIILREIYRHPDSAAGGLPQRNSAISNLMRERELLFLREEGDFSFGDDDEEEALDESEDEEEDADDREIDQDAASYVDTSVTDEREDDM